jgi:hypothetical protein
MSRSSHLPNRNGQQQQQQQQQRPAGRPAGLAPPRDVRCRGRTDGSRGVGTSGGAAAPATTSCGAFFLSADALLLGGLGELLVAGCSAPAATGAATAAGRGGSRFVSPRRGMARGGRRRRRRRRLPSGAWPVRAHHRAGGVLRRAIGTVPTPTGSSGRRGGYTNNGPVPGPSPSSSPSNAAEDEAMGGHRQQRTCRRREKRRLPFPSRSRQGR